MSDYTSARPRRAPIKSEPIKIDKDVPLNVSSAVEASIDVEHEVEQHREASVARPSMRPSLRPESSRELAAKRAAEIMGNLGGAIEEGSDKFYIDPSSIPDGWDYNWKRKTVYGQEDPAYQVSLSRTGWEPVPTTRHPNMMPAGNYPTIERDGMILMMRPKIISEQFENSEKKRAREQVKFKEQQLNQAPDGQFERNHRDARPKIGKSYEAIPIPND